MKPKDPIYHLTPNLFTQMLKVGANKILTREKEINAINVFPVNDHDTGTNISSLMRFLIMNQYQKNSFSDLFQEIADSSLIGAAGNSGIIFSAFFSGLASDKTLKHTKLSAQEFFQCICAGVQEAYNAVTHPIEGTILTVMQAWVHAFKDHVEHKVADFILLFKNSIQQAEEALKKTERQIPVLKKNQVVDAGAYAFLLMIKGMFDCLNEEECEDDIDILPLPAINFDSVNTHEGESKYRYCFETILITQKEADTIKQQLESLGDSMVINKSPSYLKIHLHTDDLFHATEILQKIGKIQHQKVDDMHKQRAINYNRQSSIGLVTDSSASLPKEFAEKYQIHTVAAHVYLNDHVLLDDLTVNLNQIHQAIYEKNLPGSTSTPSPEAVFRQLSYLSSIYESLIVVTVSAKMSGMHQLFVQESKKLNNKNITIVDSQQNSLAHGLIVMKIAEWIEDGVTHAEIINRIPSLTSNAHIIFSVNDFKKIIKSGRAPKVIGLIANLTKFNPVINIKNGKPTLSALAFGKKQSEKKLLKLIKKYIATAKISQLAIVHTCEEKKAQQFSETLENECGVKPLFIQNPAASIGLHIGKGCMGVAILKDSLRYLN